MGLVGFLVGRNCRILGDMCQQKGRMHTTLHTIFNNANMSSLCRSFKGTACATPGRQRLPHPRHATLPHTPMGTHGEKLELKN
jgi:hypothetical protein